ncbi:carbohydrate ABC transporter permease [Aureimonas fodinaquatilis]|uniref:Carbohydrate ABC transporter permease n=1 Tax=Aureimonas fodinaquatilis TaxID=2565783 RepID=A0A5B0E2K9_9HYPH|nr:carbohydrate ABC transporter permease [Aureimonas fodinaquatilis]KAA0971990.1 carbohydrate ABC transporter permease [Aureimonas fodinaquatilis]
MKHRSVWLFLPLLILLVIAVFPFLWMALSSFKPLAQLYSIPPQWIPNPPTLRNFQEVLFNSNIPRYFLNSTIVSLGSTGLALIFAIFAAYGFARFRFFGKSFAITFVLVGQLLPTATVIVPLYLVLNHFNLINTYLGLILVYLILTLPLSVWMLTGFFRAIPTELEEAAIIDGATRLGVLFRISLPLIVPGIVSVVLYSFVATWNEFVFALSFATDRTMKTLPIGLAEFSTEFDVDWGAVMAASFIMTLPIALIFLVLQRLFVSGLMSGATKG